jgi:maltooligosyltrehalose trehalohydrolase
MPFGTSLLGSGEVRFRLWAPGAGSVELLLGAGETPVAVPMQGLGHGWFERRTAADPGARYPKKSSTHPWRAVCSPPAGIRGDDSAARPGPVNLAAGAILDH